MLLQLSEHNASLSQADSSDITMSHAQQWLPSTKHNETKNENRQLMPFVLVLSTNSITKD